MTKSIIQWNCRGLRPNFTDFRLLCDKYNPIVCCLQETFLSSDDYVIRGFSSYHLVIRDVGDRPCGGVSVLVRDSIPHSECTLNTTLQARAVTISTSKTITVCSLYLPPSENLNIVLLNQLVDQLPTPFIICGDFNGHSITWGCESNNSRGRKIDDFITTHDSLCLLNDGSFTYLHPASGTFTAIDLSLCSPTIFTDVNFRVASDSYGSDHFPIILEIGVSLPDPLPRWNFRRADWVHFIQLCREKLTLDTVEMYEEPIVVFTDMLCNIAKETIPRSVTKPKKRCNPWFNKDCKDALKERQRALHKFEKNINAENLSNFRIARAKARRICRASKRESFHKYVSRITPRTTMTSVWDMVHRIGGKYKSTTVSHLCVNNNKITDTQEISDTLAQSFAYNSSTQNYSNSFNRHRGAKERAQIDFDIDELLVYNELFTLHELKQALQKSHDTSPGSDTVHYQLLKHLPEQSLLLLLFVFNTIWITQDFPNSWRDAIIIPIPKPGKDSSNPCNYRPIALTSCLCKTMERMVNQRLVWFLEKNNILTKHQSGFRKKRSTTDHLVKLESTIRDAFLNKRHLVSIFFDLEKAYDMTWKHGILQDLYEAGLRGRLPMFVSSFLSDRVFRVRVDNTLSDSFTQEMGVPQGSILSVTLFSLKINSIVSCLHRDVECSLFVDDLAIYYSSRHMVSIERKLQQCLNKLQEWCDKNGFRFSSTKTVCVHFCRQKIPHLDPEIQLNGNLIPVVDETRFLGLIFDKKLSFISHITQLKSRCSSALNLLKVLANTSWGADRKILLRLYDALIRSKLDFGCIVIGSACKSYIKRLEPIHNQGVRLSLGAFRTSPMQSLYIEANNPPLYLRRTRLSLQYCSQLMSNERNPAYPVVFQPQYRALYENKEKAIKPLGLRVEKHLDEVGFHPHMIAPSKVTSTPPWKFIVPDVRFDLCKHKKSETDPVYFRLFFAELLEQFRDHTHIYTDGSKDGVKTALAFVSPSFIFSKRLPDKASIFTAEMEALTSALRYIKVLDSSKFVIFCDSKSALQALLSKWDHPSVLCILKFLIDLHTTHKTVVFCWLPSHMGITGNEKADAAAKAALEKEVSECLLPYSDSRQYIGQYVRDLWQREWDMAVHNKLHAIKPTIGGQSFTYRSRKEQVILDRLRIGHTRLTHSFLLKGEPPPECTTCECQLTIQHILVDCIEYDFIRPELFGNNTTLKDIFDNVSSDDIVMFIKRAHLFNEL